MIKEARVLAALGKHPNIVGLVDTAVSENRFCLFLEMGSCDLKHLKEKYPALTEHDILGYAMDILAGMTHMHKCRVFHLDMKPENVIICQMKGKVAKIIDFGLARSATLHNKKERLSAPGSWASMGTDCYICPEAWELGGDDLPDDEFLAKRDSFAVGLTLINGLLVPFLNLEKKAELVAMKVARSGLGEEKETVVDRIKYWKQNLRQETAKQGKKMLLDLAEAACGLIDEYYRTRLTVEDALRLVKKNAEFVKTKKGMFEITKI
jgi:serine/threonine protein kinase